MLIGRTLTRLVLPVALAAFVAAGCGGGDGVLGFGGIPSGAVCAVDGEGIPKKEYDRMFATAQKQYKDNGRDFPKKGSDEYESLRSDLVEYLVQRQIVLNQADKFGFEVSDKEIDKGVKDLKQQVAQGDEKKFKEEMKRVDYTLDMVKADVKFDVISRKVYEKVVDDIKISDKDAQAYFDENPDQFATKESREIAHILVKTKKEADAIYAQVKDGDEATFTKLAKQKTLDESSKATGGVLPGGAVQREQTVPEFDKTAFSLKTGEVSKPVKTDYGWHVISARGDIKPAAKKKFSEVKDDIKTQLKGEQEGERYQEWNTDVRKDAEDSVKCKKGYVWKQTVKETETTAPPAATTEGDAKKDDAKKDDAKKDDAKKDDAKADDAKKDDAEK